MVMVASDLTKCIVSTYKPTPKGGYHRPLCYLDLVLIPLTYKDEVV